MVIILAIFIAICTFAWSNAWPLLNLAVGSLSIIQFFILFLWLLLGLLAISGFIFVFGWWVKNGILFKPSKWNATWFSFGIIRWILTFGLFYLVFLIPVPSTGSSISDNSPWFGLIIFLLFSFGIYEKFTLLRVWWELRSLPPDLLRKIELDFETYAVNFDPLAHKLGLLKLD
jgi:hypothetical protein